MPESSGRVGFRYLYAVAVLALGASTHAFVTEGFGVSGAVSAILAVALAVEATRQRRTNSRKQAEPRS